MVDSALLTGEVLTFKCGAGGRTGDGAGAGTGGGAGGGTGGGAGG